MFFHIDESGNTGNNLFDENQPRLSYGLISSVTNVDVLCVAEHNTILGIIKDDLIHANILGVGGLVKIAPLLIEIQKKMKFDFDYYYIEKLDYALVVFFDAVFDAGLNDAVKWDVYWTPLRYVLIQKLSILFDEKLLRESWRLSTVKKIKNHEIDIIAMLSEIRERAKKATLDARSKEVIIDALEFGIRNPLSLDFGHPDQKIISPNAVGFQFVISAIARRTRNKRRKTVSSIIVDRQNQFNKSQVETHDILSKMADSIKKSSVQDQAMYFNNPLYAGFLPGEVSHKGLTDRELTISKSTDSIGLQIVDVYLWIANKLISGVNLPPELMNLWLLFQHRNLIDGISLGGMAQRFSNFEKNLPKLDELTNEQRIVVKESVDKHREKVKNLI